jgi:hypothetical protein
LKGPRQVGKTSVLERLGTHHVVYLDDAAVRSRAIENPRLFLDALPARVVLDEAALFQKALKLFRDRNWDLAELQLLNLQKRSPGRKLYQLYLERVTLYRADPPPADWDGRRTCRA